MSKVISVFSGAGGVGKSVVSASLGLSFSALGKRTVIIELEIGSRSQDLLLGAGGIYDLGDVLERRAEPEKAIIPTSAPNLGVILASLNMYTPVSGQFDALLDKLSAEYDVVLLDSPAGKLIPFLVKLSDFCIIVSTTDIKVQRDCASLAESLDFSESEPRLIINKLDLDAKLDLDLDKVIDKIGVRLLGVLPAQKDITDKEGGLQMGKLYRKCTDNICGRLMGKHIPLTIK